MANNVGKIMWWGNSAANKELRERNGNPMKAKNIFGETITIKEMKIMKESYVYREMLGEEVAITRTPLGGCDEPEFEDRRKEKLEYAIEEEIGYSDFAPWYCSEQF